MFFGIKIADTFTGVGYLRISKILRIFAVCYQHINIVDEYQEEGNAVVNYNPNNNKTTIGKGDESDAKKN